MLSRLFLFCLGFSLLAVFNLNAQVLTVSEEITLRTDTDYHLVGKMGGKTVLFHDRTNKHFVTAYDRRMQESWEKELQLRGRNIRVLDVLENTRGFHIVYLFRNGGRNFLQVDAYDPAANLRDSVTMADFGFFASSPSYELVRSQDRSKALLVLAEQQTKVNVISMDFDSLQLLYNVQIKPKDFYFNENFLQSEVNDVGDGYLILERDNFQSRRKEHHYEVFELKAEDQHLNNFNLMMGDSLTYDVYFRYDNLNDRLLGAGLYSIRDLLHTQGHFYLAISPSDTTSFNLRFEPFPVELIENIEGKKLRNNNKRKGLDQLSIRDAILREDGGLLLVMERNRQLERRAVATQSQVLNSYNGRPLVDYYYDELLITSINPSGTAYWNTILHKKQYSQDDGGAFSSFMLLESPSRLRFLFNDEIRFENTVSEYVLNGTGSFDRNSLFHTRDLELKLRFRDGVQVAANEVIIPSERRNRLRLVTLTY